MTIMLVQVLCHIQVVLLLYKTYNTNVPHVSLGQNKLWTQIFIIFFLLIFCLHELKENIIWK